MALLNIRTLGDPLLRQKARRVKTVNKEIRKLVDDMYETMVAGSGVGLAATQVGVPERVIVIEVSEEAEDADEVKAAVDYVSPYEDGSGVVDVLRRWSSSFDKQRKM